MNNNNQSSRGRNIGNSKSVRYTKLTSDNGQQAMSTISVSSVQLLSKSFTESLFILLQTLNITATLSHHTDTDSNEVRKQMTVFNIHIRNPMM
jgi:hypothetical protein